MINTDFAMTKVQLSCPMGAECEYKTDEVNSMDNAMLLLLMHAKLAHQLSMLVWGKFAMGDKFATYTTEEGKQKPDKKYEDTSDKKEAAEAVYTGDSEDRRLCRRGN